MTPPSSHPPKYMHLLMLLIVSDSKYEEVYKLIIQEEQNVT